MLQSKFKTGSWQWELSQRAKVAKAKAQGTSTKGVRDYRVLLSANNVKESEVQQSLSDIVTGRNAIGPYLETETHCFTVRGRALGFRMAAKAGAGLEGSLLHRHRQYPFPTLRMPREPGLATQVYRDATSTVCKGGYVDAWTIDLVRMYPSPEALESEACTAILVMVWMMAWTCTGLIETLHASIRRLIKAHSVQTHLYSWLDLNSDWMMHCVRRSNSRTFQMIGGDAVVAKPPTGRKRKRSTPVVTSRGDAVEDNKAARRTGGTWRAFLRKKLFGVARFCWKVMMPLLSQEYHDLDAQQKEELKQVGKAATLAGRKKASKYMSSFGPRSRDIKQESVRNMVKAMHATMEEADRVADAVDALTDLQHSTTNVGDAYKVALAYSTTGTRTELAQMASEAEQLHDFNKTHGASSTEAVRKLMPALVETESLFAVPTECGYCFSQANGEEAITDKVVGLTAYWNKHYGGETNIRSTDDAWKAMNECLREEDCECVDDSAPATNPCSRAGICLCTDTGKQLKKFRDAFSTLCVKMIAPPHTPERKALKDGCWAFHFKGITALPAGEPSPTTSLRSTTWCSTRPSTP